MKQAQPGRPWTAEEDGAVVYAHRAFGDDWLEISKSLPGRSTKEIRARWADFAHSRPSLESSFKFAPSSPSGYEGVVQLAPRRAAKRGGSRYAAEVQTGSQRVGLGTFDTAVEAAAAVRASKGRVRA